MEWNGMEWTLFGFQSWPPSIVRSNAVRNRTWSTGKKMCSNLRASFQSHSSIIQESLSETSSLGFHCEKIRVRTYVCTLYSVLMAVCHQHNQFHWNELDLSGGLGLRHTRLDRIRWDRTGLDWTEPDGIQFNLHWTGVAWNGPERTGSFLEVFLRGCGGWCELGGKVVSRWMAFPSVVKILGQ